MLNRYKIILIFVLCTVYNLVGQNTASFPRWQEGELEIHHINTGKGECVFCILPDGTTLLIDAGDLGYKKDPRRTEAVPNDSRAPGEWIARYIANILPFADKKSIDYAMITHFDKDHIGSFSRDHRNIHPQGNYVLSGISEVNQFVPINKLIDRNFPNYDYPYPLTQPHMLEYRKFVEWNIQHSGMQAERFQAGSNSQFVLLHRPDAYKQTFEIRNIVANGEVWTGVGSETRQHFPLPETLKAEEHISENQCSAGIRISYGAFDYFNGGDLVGYRGYNSSDWEDIETPVGKVVGPVEVCEVNHHAWWNAMNANFIASLRPMVYIMQVWNVSHFNIETLERMQSPKIYKGERDIFATNTPEISKLYVGEYLKRLKCERGHIVIKVYKGGTSFRVYILDDETECFRVKSAHGPYICK